MTIYVPQMSSLVSPCIVFTTLQALFGDVCDITTHLEEINTVS